MISYLFVLALLLCVPSESLRPIHLAQKDASLSAMEISSETMAKLNFAGASEPEDAKDQKIGKQMFGLESELKWTRISQGDPGTPFYSFALNTIEAIYIGKGTYKNLEIHLDMATDGLGWALIEFVTRGTNGAVGLTYTEFATTLKVLRQMKKDHFGKNTEEFKSFLESNFELNVANPLIKEMETKDQIDLSNHFYDHLEVYDQDSRGTYPAVQITTSLTVKEMISFMRAGVPTDGCFTDKEALKQKGDLEIMRYLDSLPQYPDCDKKALGKGSRRLMKHAYEQFLISNSELLADTSVSMDKKTSCTHNLKTKANKLAPVVYRSPGEIAYVIEFRGNGPWEKKVTEFINKADKNSGLEEPEADTICLGCAEIYAKDENGAKETKVGPGKCCKCGLDLGSQDCKNIFHLTDSKADRNLIEKYGKKYCCMVTTELGNTKFTKTKCGDCAKTKVK